jgi:hypothetical protein
MSPRFSTGASRSSCRDDNLRRSLYLKACLKLDKPKETKGQIPREWESALFLGGFLIS